MSNEDITATRAILENAAFGTLCDERESYGTASRIYQVGGEYNTVAKVGRTTAANAITHGMNVLPQFLTELEGKRNALDEIAALIRKTQESDDDDTVLISSSALLAILEASQ